MTLIKAPLGCERKKQNAGLYGTYVRHLHNASGLVPVRFRRCVFDMIRAAACKKKTLDPQSEDKSPCRLYHNAKSA